MRHRQLQPFDMLSLVAMVIAAVMLGAASLAGAADVTAREAPYRGTIRVLSGLLRFELSGVLWDRVETSTGRYEARVTGAGDDIDLQLESSGVMRDGRWTPRTTRLALSVYGRRWRTETAYDLDRGAVEFHSRGESFFLRRVRRADDVLQLSPSSHVDDVITVLLNYGDRLWPAETDGSYRTHLVRRSGTPQTGDDGRPVYRAELRPLVLRPEGDGTAAIVDITGFTGWGLADRPARFSFAPSGRLTRIEARLRFGTSVEIDLAPTDGPHARATSRVARRSPVR